MNRPQPAHRRMPRPARLLPALALAAAVAVALPLALTASGSRTRRTRRRPADGSYRPTRTARPVSTTAPTAGRSRSTAQPPYREPNISGHPVYGGYIGMAGNWARWSGCGGNIAWSSADSAAANTNYTTYGKGIGTGVYWFMGGPGVDPHYNGTTTEASSWGAAQAAKTLKAMGSLKVTYKIVWLDIELPGIKPALDNGWNNVYTSPCSGKIKTGRHRGVRGPGRGQRLRGLPDRALLLRAGRVLVPVDLGFHLRHRAAPRTFPAPTSGRTPTPPAGCPSPRSSGASWARPPAPGSSAG